MLIPYILVLVEQFVNFWGFLEASTPVGDQTDGVLECDTNPL